MQANNGSLRITWTRWLRAQEYEQTFWERLADRIADGTTGELDWYDWRARQLEKHLASILDPTRKAGRILEIGTGPVGIVNFLGWGERYAVDPLEHLYRQRPGLINLRKPGTTYLPGTGEQLPFDHGSFSIVIIDNVIDHTYAPGKVLQEIYRVLGPDGYFYLSVNVHTAWGAVLHKGLAALRIDEGHPHTFTSGSLRRLLARNHFTILLEHVDDYGHVRRTNSESARFKDRVKGYTGLSEFLHTVVCCKNALTLHT